MTNPFAPVPTSTSAGTLISGGGGDGQVSRVVALCLERVNLRPGGLVDADPGIVDSRQFDLAELISWACAASGVPTTPPIRGDLLLMHCQSKRTVIDVEEALDTKGALVFAGYAPGLVIGSRRRVIVYSPMSGPVVVPDTARPWTSAAKIPTAKGYR